MKIDYADTIKYITENFDKLEINQTGRQDLKSLLKFIKTQVEFQTIQRVVQGDSGIREQIEEAKQKLEERIASLEQQANKEEGKLEYPEFVAGVRNDSVPIEAQEKAEMREKNKYEKQKAEWEKTQKPRIERRIATLRSKVQELEQIVGSLDKPEEFIQKFLNRGKEGQRLEIRNKNLVHACAMGMKGTNVEEIFEGSPLFETAKTGEYVPNPEAISEFLEIIRNPQLVQELDEYCTVRNSVEKDSQSLESERRFLQKAQDLQAVLNMPEACQEAEGQIKQRFDANRNLLAASNQLRKLQVPTNYETSSWFRKILDKISGEERRRKEETTRYEEASKKESDCRKECEALDQEHSEKCQNIPGYAKAYEAYLYAADGKSQKDRRISGEDKSIAKIVELSADEGNSMHQVVVRRLDPEKRVSDAERGVEAVTERLAKSQENLDRLGEALSPEAKSLVDRGINMAGIRAKYMELEANPNRPYAASPLVSSLILETLMKSNNIRTTEDAQKFGLVIQPEELQRYEGKAKVTSSDLIGYIQGLSQKGQSLEENDDDAR